MSSITTADPDSAASRHGPNPVSYCRSSNASASGPVTPKLRTRPRSTSVTDAAAVPGIAAQASSAMRPRASLSGSSASEMRLSSASTRDV